MGESAIDTTGSCGPQGVHNPSPFEKENSVGEQGHYIQPEEVRKQMLWGHSLHPIGDFRDL